MIHLQKFEGQSLWWLLGAGTYKAREYGDGGCDDDGTHAAVIRKAKDVGSHVAVGEQARENRNILDWLRAASGRNRPKLTLQKLLDRRPATTTRVKLKTTLLLHFAITRNILFNSDDVLEEWKLNYNWKRWCFCELFIQKLRIIIYTTRTSKCQANNNTWARSGKPKLAQN